MKKLMSWISIGFLLFCCFCGSATAETITLGNDVIANTTPFGDVAINRQYQLYKGMTVTLLGEYDGWTIIKYQNEFGIDEFGSLFIETGEHGNTGTGTNLVPVEMGNEIKYGVVGAGWQVWARYEPKAIFDDGESKGDRILHAGDKIEINGEIVKDEQGNEYYPIRIEDRTGTGYVQRYVSAKYIDILID